MGDLGSIPLLYFIKFTFTIIYVHLIISQLGINFNFFAGMVQISLENAQRE